MPSAVLALHGIPNSVVLLRSVPPSSKFFRRMPKHRVNDCHVLQSVEQVADSWHFVLPIDASKRKSSDFPSACRLIRKAAKTATIFSLRA